MSIEEEEKYPHPYKPIAGIFHEDSVPVDFSDDEQDDDIPAIPVASKFRVKSITTRNSYSLSSSDMPACNVGESQGAFLSKAKAAAYIDNDVWQFGSCNTIKTILNTLDSQPLRNSTQVTGTQGFQPSDRTCPRAASSRDRMK